MATWNVEGLSDTKVVELIEFMRRKDIGVLCLQETHICNSPYYSVDGFLVILSGSASTHRESAGVGFILSPLAQKSLVGFLQKTNRLACLKLRVLGGQVALICAYAPHSSHAFDVRQSFFQDLKVAYERTSVNGPKFILGDLNARSGHALPGEERIFGPHTLGNSTVHKEKGSNRDLLLELCEDHGLAVANTFFPNPIEQQATYRHIGVERSAPFTERSHLQLDLILLPQEDVSSIRRIQSEPSEPLASHHYAVTAQLDVSLDAAAHQKPAKHDRSVLKDTAVARAFASKFSEKLHDASRHGTPDMMGGLIDTAFKHAEKDCLPIRKAKKQKPWISTLTLDLIEQRATARVNHDFATELSLQKQIKQSARSDRRNWLEQLAGSNDWRSLHKLRKGTSLKQGRLKDASGDFVDNTVRADTFAEYLSSVQWASRPITAMSETPLFEVLPVNQQEITMSELRAALKKFRLGKASGPDDIPIEYWQAVVFNPGQGADWLLSFCNCIWSGQSVPQSWHLQRVAMVFKKEDPAICGNYRPICLLNSAYKVFAMIILRRLLEAGADERMWASQFGFRPKRNTEQALHCVRRAIEAAQGHKNGRVHLLALDWAKAFDSINPQALLMSLRRFGLPDHVLNVISSIYSDRQFFVEECGVRSCAAPQSSGICQGCPLSPFLFGIVMTTLMSDAYDLLGQSARHDCDLGLLYDILYADDTLLLGSAACHVEELANAVAIVGLQYGLSLHWQKTQALSVGTATPLRRPDGTVINDSGTMIYLGGLLASNQGSQSELSRRIGLAASTFRSLAKVWSHSGVQVVDKLKYFNCFVISVLSYGLSTLPFTKEQSRRMDGFHARCLRRILKIPAAFYSRISNQDVFKKAGVLPFSKQLLSRQVTLFRQVMKSPAGDPLRRNTLTNQNQSYMDLFVRRRGRPQLNWTDYVMKHAT